MEQSAKITHGSTILNYTGCKFVYNAYNWKFLGIMDKTLLDILVCPKTKEKLIIADAGTIDKINKDITNKKCKNINGESVTETIKEGLLAPQSKVLYIIKDDIPMLIYEGGIIIS